MCRRKLRRGGGGGGEPHPKRCPALVGETNGDLCTKKMTCGVVWSTREEYSRRGMPYSYPTIPAIVDVPAPSKSAGQSFDNAMVRLRLKAIGVTLWFIYGGLEVACDITWVEWGKILYVKYSKSTIHLN